MPMSLRVVTAENVKV